MAPLRIIAAALLLIATPARADGITRWRVYIDEASVRFGVPAAWIERVMRAESGGRTLLDGRPITSRAGAMGLMQLMPGTWADLRGALGLGADPHQPRDNILAGTRYLRMMYDRFGYPGCFAAYNAGPARYAAYLAGRSRLPAETVAYVSAVAGSLAARPVPAQFGDMSGTAPAPLPSSEDLFFIRKVGN
jgi:soluble lytic murein transglycosylase-like protein